MSPDPADRPPHSTEATLAEHLDSALASAHDLDQGRPHRLLRTDPNAAPETDPDLLAVALCSPDGLLQSAGASTHPFPLQSVSKAFAYALALEDCGFAAVRARVDVEPSGESYDALSLEAGSRRPDNPMINAGAMAVTALIGGSDATVEDRIQRLRDGMSRMAGRDLDVDEDGARRELAGANRNIAIAHMLKAEGIVDLEPMDVVRTYLWQCWITVTTEDLARMAATLACGGRQPRTGEQLVSPAVARQTLSVMMTCGMYDSAGDWMSEVGIPAKSGVSGAIMGAVPGRAGLAAFSPRLDIHGTSVRAEAVLHRLTNDLQLHLLDDPLRPDNEWNRLRRLSTSQKRMH